MKNFMYILKYLFLVIVFFGCSPSKNPEIGSDTSKVGLVLKGNYSHSDTVQVYICDTISINWDNCNNDIIEDTYYAAAIVYYNESKCRMTEAIINSNVTSAKICNLDRNLFAGEVAFLFIDKLENLPYASIFQVQFDVLTIDCPYLYGIPEGIYENRYSWSHKICVYLQSNQDI